MGDNGDEDKLIALVRHGRQIDAEIKDLLERKKSIVRMIDLATDIGWRLIVDGIAAVKTTGNRSFSPALAIERFTEDQKLSVVSTSIDFKAVRALADVLGITEDCMVAPDLDKSSVKLG